MTPTPEDRAAAELVRAIAAVDVPKTLRFSKCEAGYRWGSVQTNSVEVMQCLLALWNARHLIADRLAATPAIAAAAYQRGLGDGIERAAGIADNIESPFDHHSDTQTDHGFCTASEMIATAIRNLKGD